MTYKLNLYRITASCTAMMLLLFSCSDNEEIVQQPLPKLDSIRQLPVQEYNHEFFMNYLSDSFVQLPEASVSISTDSSMYAQYSYPTSRYQHGILGDKTEGAQLDVIYSLSVYSLRLPEQYVFEDIQPRLADIQGDSTPEIICIRSNIETGGGIMIYELSITENSLKEYAYVPEIGVKN